MNLNNYINIYVKTYIKIEYDEITLLSVRVVKLISSFKTLGDALKFALTLDNVGIDKVIVKFDENLFEIDRSTDQAIISFVLDLFDFEGEFK